MSFFGYRPAFRGNRRTPPFDAGVTRIASSSAMGGHPSARRLASTPFGGGLLDPMELLDPPVRGDLLDPSGWRELHEERRRTRLKRQDLPPALQGVPLGPEGGLIGFMLAEHVEPDGASAPAQGSHAESDWLPIPPTKPPYPKIPLPASADWADKGFGGPRGDVSIPTINLEAQRRANILADRPAQFDIADNPNALGEPPSHAIHYFGAHAVKKYAPLIEAEARRQGVDPNLVKAIMYVENAQGWYGYPFEPIGLADSLFPMNINPELWSELAGPNANLNNARLNVRAGVALIRRIQDRLTQPSVAKIAEIYNFGGAETVGHYGARVARVYHKKSWER